MNFHDARKQKIIQSPFENIRCKADPENFHKKSFYYSDPRAKDPFTNEKLSPLNRNERTTIITES